ncbi:MAG: hypothetical protein GW873_03495 [Nitrospirae bacterium]|nr:hypothetical protein [Nitrospirota bacterium]
METKYEKGLEGEKYVASNISKLGYSNCHIFISMILSNSSKKAWNNLA